MPDLQPTYSVILKAEIPSVERERLRHYCHEIHGNDGSTLFHFLCTRIDTSHCAYMTMETLMPQNAGMRTVRIPHTYVFLIDGDGDRPVLTRPGNDGELLPWPA